MVEAILAVATKSLVEGFVKNYVVPKLAQLAHNFSTEAKSYLNVNSTSFVAYYKRAYNNYSIINTLAFKERVKKLKDIYIPLTLYSIDNKEKSHIRKSKDILKICWISISEFSLLILREWVNRL